jgi:hypothetical protein
MLLRPGLPQAGAQDQWALELKWDGMRAHLRVGRDGRRARRIAGRRARRQLTVDRLLREPSTGRDGRGRATVPADGYPIATKR